MKLLIVESPTKAKTIETYLNGDYRVLSSKGTLRDLSKSGTGGFGVDLKDNFKPIYQPLPDKEDVIKELVNASAKCDDVLIATDPDREGEAIAWHIADILSLPLDKLNRIVFHEITKKEVQKQINSPRNIDLNLVHSQETRRIIDRIIGFRLSGLAKSKIGGNSAGRVQTVALKLVCELEDEINKFVPQHYFDINLYQPKGAKFDHDDSATYNFTGNYQNVKAIDIDETKKDEIIASASNPFVVTSVKERVSETKPKLPFITSTIQQEAFNLFGYSAKRTMSILQGLFEGVLINDTRCGLITYMRTDSKRLSPDFLRDATNFVNKSIGPEYVGVYVMPAQKHQVQDAHEAIRPTDVSLTPQYIKPFVDTPSYNLYKLIYERSIQVVIKPAQTLITDVVLSSNGHNFLVTGKRNTFKGCLYFNKIKDVIIPVFNVGDKIDNLIVIADGKETKPPARYTESSLIKKLEDLGIGRPSTYATIMQSLKTRDYVNVVQKHFVPTPLGVKTIIKLDPYFNNLINVKYTASLEVKLDEIASKKLDYKAYLNDFYTEFDAAYLIAKKEMPKENYEVTDKTCPDCGNLLVVKHSRYGEFTCCSNYPKCKYIEHKQNNNIVLDDELCPKCGLKMVLKQGRFGEFKACSGFPDCRYIEQKQTILEELCPECGKNLTTKRGRYGTFVACSGYPTCKYIEKKKKTTKEA